MSLINGLISEVLANFKNPIQSTNNKLFQIQLRGNSHIKFHVKIIMEGSKRPGSSPTWNHIHHGRLNFQEAQLSQISSDKGNNFRSDDEGFSRFLVHDQIQVPFSVSRLLVLESDMDFRQHVKAWGKQYDLSWSDWKLPSLRSTWEADHTDDVPSAEFWMYLGEPLQAFVVVDVAHYLHFLAITL